MSVPGRMFSYTTEERIVSRVVRISSGSASLSNSVSVFVILPFMPLAEPIREKAILLSFPESVNSEESSEILYGNEYLPLDVEIESPCLYRRLSMSVKRLFRLLRGFPYRSGPYKKNRP